MHFVIMGSGAVGGYFGGRLAQAGEKVTFIARNEHYKMMKQHGLTIHSIVGDVHLPNITVVQNTAEIKNVDVIFIAVKSFQLPPALAQIKPIINKATRIIPLLNGVNALEAITTANIDKENVYGGLAKIISELRSPGIISHTGAKPHITLGLASVAINDEVELNRLKVIADTLKNSGVSVGITKNIQIAIWRKFIFVAAWGALASLIKVPVGVLRSRQEPRMLLHSIVNEYALLANAQGVFITQVMIDETLTFIDSLPEYSETSMQKDIANGAMSEFSALVAFPKQLSDKHGINTPILDFCYTCLSAQLGFQPN